MAEKKLKDDIIKWSVDTKRRVSKQFNGIPHIRPPGKAFTEILQVVPAGASLLIQFKGMPPDIQQPEFFPDDVRKRSTIPGRAGSLSCAVGCH